MRKYILMNDKDRICPKFFSIKFIAFFLNQKKKKKKKKIMHSRIPKSKAVHAK